MTMVKILLLSRISYNLIKSSFYLSVKVRFVYLNIISNLVNTSNFTGLEKLFSSAA